MSKPLFEIHPVTLYNSHSRKKELFKAIIDPFVGLYVCGPTVYGDPHLGHARSAITFDIVYRYLSFLGYKVRYVRNITDVGHLENDADEGEDKIAKKARLDQVEPMEIVQKYTISYHQCMDQLNVKRPSIEPTASGHIIEQIEIIKKIIDNGLAYEIDGSVYFDISKYSEQNHYGSLSGKVLEDMLSGSRTNLDGQQEKKNPNDFALWKKAKPEHIMQWPSPWGMGFPGWHLECTAMSTKYLGAPFDIHGGGMDLQFPHHEGEIAQCKGAFGCEPVNYWMHNNMLTINGQKMGKSLGNFITLEELFAGEHKLLEQPYSPMVIRFFMLQAHYGSTLDFSNTALQAAEKALQKVQNGLYLCEKIEHSGIKTESDTIDSEVDLLIEQFCKEMSNDFNTAKALAVIFQMLGLLNEIYNGQLKFSKISPAKLNNLKLNYRLFVTEVLGIIPAKQDNQVNLDGAVEILINLRSQAKKTKNFALADQIRDQLLEKGIQLKDERNGATTYSIA
ncbi:MAG: cysteine--tRNA ligase [Luteibaculaceae bacterium]